MQFSHLIQVTNPSDPEIAPLSREQLWRGLVKRAEKPLHFLFGLDQCQILERGPDRMERQLHFGRLVIRDRVTFEPDIQVRYDIEATAESPGGRLVMRIEEPEAGHLFVRFDYELHVDGGTANDFYNEFRKSAYVEADIDTVRAIRQLAADGWL